MTYGHPSCFHTSHSRQQQFQIFFGQVADEAVVGVDDGVGEIAFGVLEREDFFFDCVAGDDAVSEDLSRLAEAVRAVNRLCLDRWVPPRVKQIDVFGRRQVQSQSACLQADQEQLAAGVILEPLDARLLSLVEPSRYSYSIFSLSRRRRR